MVPLFKILNVGYGNLSVLSINVNVCYNSKMQHNASLCIFTLIFSKHTMCDIHTSVL